MVWKSRDGVRFPELLDSLLLSDEGRGKEKSYNQGD